MAHNDIAVDPASAARLAEAGLELRRMANDGSELVAWHGAQARGFLETERTAVQDAAVAERWRGRRLIGVLDPTGPQPDWPVGTVSSWVAALSLPGGTAPAWAISSVTVAPTHHRRGIARALLEGELRAAASAGVPIASLTVTESPLYGRYGFAPAVSVATLSIDVKRASWTGPVAPGRVDFVTREQWRREAPALADRVFAQRPGELTASDGHWDHIAGTAADADRPERIRTVRYRDVHDEVQGLLAYTVTENTEDYTRSRVDVRALVAADDAASAALWRFLVELDLVQTVVATEQSIDEPVLWMISDRRAATVTLHDHHYVRILDVTAALQARRYRRPGRLLLQITDTLGLAGGAFVLTVDDDGSASVAPASARATAPVTLTADVVALSALLLGQVSARTLAAAGRLSATDAGAVADVFGWDPPARLSYWY
ncbi:MAG: GNAT family N-acetyltransferase [Microbacterium sp.]|uniref:GNAT family N-acetyltransferase n=1 Tax=Microbacterium sp. TaxID=51671 RepID=UPI0039E3766F